MRAEDIVQQLQMQEIAHEGGWFCRTYSLEAEKGGRALATTIYALFTRDWFSALHRLDAAEQFFFVDGDAFETFCIDREGRGRRELLGRDLASGQSPHLVFNPGEWFGGKPVSDGSRGWSLMCCAMTPGFEWSGFELGERAQLVSEFAEYSSEIDALTRA